ncbi:disease resistance protein RGA2 [Elaeis guineensis]|uniref:Disease resistance protein RGA3 n=1 Tax=Elaeis guineensis var. tenera TaxID=51953 RepID=A0A6I9QZM8_ELAGV|nr:putative disease resistance protein RGA3 [Elaeis guineensis]
MAELALSTTMPIVEMVVKKLASGFWKELGLVGSVYTDLEELQSELSTIKNVLDDAEKKSVTNKTLQGWLKKLRDAAFDADDVVDELQTEALQRKIVRHDPMTEKVRDFFSSNNTIAFRYKMARKIKGIRERLDKIAQERLRYHLAEGSISENTLDRETFSSVIESEIYGRDDDKKDVIKFLVDKDNDKNISILPIVGLGGVGKTTLAQLAYNDDRIQKQFELRMWVCVGESFDAKVILQAMIEQVTKEQSNFSTLETMSSFLQEKLRTKRFLLVLDDLWNEDESKWDKIKPLFVRSKLGCKIIITTRSEIVASITGTILPHRLQGLGIDDCWALFKQKAFGLGRQEETPMLVDIGKEIVKKCGGLPLAAKILGSLMGTKRGEAAWLAIKDNKIWKLSKDVVGILPILNLSYDHLPPHLKRCFTYCSVFPKDYKFEIKRLIQLWMAEGLIDTSNTYQNAEDIGRQYFESLLWRSFFQDVQMDEYSNIDTCKMHDLVHDLACSLTKDETLVIEMDRDMDMESISRCRYLLVMCNNVSSATLETTYKAKKLRSLIVLGVGSGCTHDMDKFIFNVTKNFTQLRALDLKVHYIWKLSDRISRLKHLRFLDLSYTEITALPTSITRLYNLQTLNLQECSNLEELPEGISNLGNLRHIDISECSSLSCVPHGLGRLSNLQTLSMFIVAQENGRTIMELQHLNSIGGGLVIKNLHHVKDPDEAMQANLRAKMRLNYLMLEWNKGLGEAQEPSSIEVARDVFVFERLQPHHNLKELDISYYMGISLPNWISRAEVVLSSFPNLVRLTLQGLERCECLPPLGQLPLLKILTMSGMGVVKRIGGEFYGVGGSGTFPSLEELYLTDMPNLEEWHIEPMMVGGKMASFPCLFELSIDACPKLMAHPCIPCFVEYLTIIASNEMLLSAANLAGLSKLKMLEIQDCQVSSSSMSGWWDGLQYLTALEELRIWECDELTCLPEGIMYLPSLHTLALEENRNMRSLEVGGRKQQQPTPFFTVLQDLQIEGADALTILPEWVGGLTSLQNLLIGECPNLTMLPDGLQNLAALQKLHISDLPQLTMLPHGLRYLTALRTLRISDCPQLAMLPNGLQHLTALQELCIISCPQLAMLPDGLQHLTTLQYLEIGDCPQLGRQCKRETGEDWHKIAHIPDIKIWQLKEEDGEESSERCTFAAKFLRQFGRVCCMGHS